MGQEPGYKCNGKLSRKCYSFSLTVRILKLYIFLEFIYCSILSTVSVNPDFLKFPICT